ncbi:MAG TPA: hypothetical protein VGU66_14360 [Candidatus Elarobacter sp.]|nr:hypothetical protein [Candidatus Elarobacter sp.]
MARAEKSDLRWAEREQQLGTWLAARATEQRRAERVPQARRLRAYATLWGWLPLAAIIFWIAYILTRSIAFHDASDPPKYRLSAFGLGKAAMTAEFVEDAADAAHVDIFIPEGVKVVRINDVSGDGACTWSASRYERKGGVWRAELRFDKPVTETEILYGSPVRAGFVTCTLTWHPLHDSYATYRMRIENWDIGSVRNAALPRGISRLNINVGAPYMESLRLVAIAGAAVRMDERTLVKGDFVYAVWRRGDAEQSRDIVLIVIGALIALGAALVVEALRGEVELAIEANQLGQPDGAPAP